MKPSTNPWKILIPRHANPNASRNIYVHSDHYADWEAIKKSHQGNYYLGTIMRAAHSLNSLAGGRTNSPSLLTQTGFAIHYLLDEKGDIRLLKLDIDKQHQIPGGQQATGVYQVLYSNDGDGYRGWRTKNRAITKMEIQHRWKEAHYAAVAGKFEDKERAGEKLVDHIRHAYKGELRGHDIDIPNKHYSLYWQNGGYRSDRQSNELASLIQQAMGQKNRVHWLAHGEGAGTFVRAMQILKASPKLHTAENDKKVRARQVVYFSNPRGKGTTTRELKELCAQLGFDLAGINRNTKDLWDSESREAFSKNGMPIIPKVIIGGAAGAFSVDTLMKSINLTAQQTNVGFTVLAGLGCYVIGKSVLNDLSGHARSLKGVCLNTMGKGNQNWAA